MNAFFSQKFVITLGLFFILALLTAACSQQEAPFECTDAIGCVTIGPGEPIKIGVLHALTGGAARTGVEQNRSIELAIAERLEPPCLRAKLCPRGDWR